MTIICKLGFQPNKNNGEAIEVKKYSSGNTVTVNIPTRGNVTETNKYIFDESGNITKLCQTRSDGTGYHEYVPGDDEFEGMREFMKNIINRNGGDEEVRNIVSKYGGSIAGHIQ